MLTKNNILHFLKNNRDKLYNEYHIQQIGLIGSFARDEQTDLSDIDFVIEFQPGTDNIYDLKINLKRYLKSHLGKEVDLCRKKYIKPYIKKYIEDEAIYV